MINNAQYLHASNGQTFFGKLGAAGCILLSQKTGRLMIGLRSEKVLEPGTWGTWGGAIEEGSNPKRTAYDELFEETGYEGPLDLQPLHTFTSPDRSFTYHNFLGVVDDEFEPWETHESNGHLWFEADDWPEPLHFGMYDLIGDISAMETLRDFVKRAKSGEDLLANAKPPERTLYHCLYQKPEGPALKATCEREVNGRSNKFLFAASHLTKSLAFSFSYHASPEEGEIICNGSIDETPDEFAVICRRSITLNAPRHIRIFAFSSEGFESAWKGGRQYVSPVDMPFEKTKLVFETSNVQDIMRKGLQIFSTEKTVEDLWNLGFMDHKFLGNKPWLHDAIRNKGFVWENEAQNINPNQYLAGKFKEYDHRSLAFSVLLRPSL